MTQGWVAGACPVLVERDHELRLLARLASETPKGRRVAVLTGESGVGKSRLVAAFVGSLPGGWLVEELDLGSGSRSDGDLDDRVSRLTASGPVAVVIEELERADVEDVDGLRESLRGLGRAQVLVLCTFRLGAHAPGSAVARATAALLCLPNAVEVRVEPLSAGGVATMAGAMGRSLGSDAVAELYRRTGGVPFYVEEVLRDPKADLPWTISEAILGRLESVPPEAVELAELLAIAGEPLSSTDIELICAGSAATVRTLTDAGFALEVEGGVTLRHQLMAEALVARLPAPRRSELHARLAGAIEAVSSPPAERLAHHWQKAGDPNRAAQWALLAADQAVARGSFGHASDLYERALTSKTRIGVDQAEVLERAAVAAATAGQTEQAERWAQQAATVFRASGLAWRAAAMWLNHALAYLRRPSVDPNELPAGHANRLALEAEGARQVGDREQASRLAGQAVEAARASGDSDAGAAAAVVLLHAGHPVEARRALEHLRDDAVVGNDPVMESRRETELSRLAFALGDVTEALVRDEAALKAARKQAEAVDEQFVRVGLAVLHALAGDLDRAAAEAQPLESSTNPVLAVMAHVPLALVDMERGRLPEARARLTQLDAFRSFAGPALFAPVLVEQARLYYLSGAPRRALHVLDDADNWVAGEFEATRADRLELRGRAAAAVNDLDQLAAAAVASAALATHVAAGPGLHATADLLAGLEARARGVPELAVAHFEAAARRWEDAPRRVLAAAAWCDAAAAADVTGEHERARRDLARGRALAEAGGYHAVLREIESTAAQGAAASPAELASLSSRELEVLRHVAAGHTNRQIAAKLYVSEKTVRNQLSSVFLKLGVERRTQAAAIAIRHGLVDDR